MDLPRLALTSMRRRSVVSRPEAERSQLYGAGSWRVGKSAAQTAGRDVLVPAGRPVDDVIRDLRAAWKTGDAIIDGGNSHFKEPTVAARRWPSWGLAFWVSACLAVSMPATDRALCPVAQPSLRRVCPISRPLRPTSGRAMRRLLGPGSAGHYVKMVHNGIEYGLMRLIAESTT